MRLRLDPFSDDSEFLSSSTSWVSAMVAALLELRSEKIIQIYEVKEIYLFS